MAPDIKLKFTSHQKIYLAVVLQYSKYMYFYRCMNVKC
jgi:hypothetical protein